VVTNFVVQNQKAADWILLKLCVAKACADFRANPCVPSLVALRVVVKEARQAGLKAEFPKGFIEGIIRSVPRYRGMIPEAVLAKARIPQV
jgi:hypothetical protein